MSEALLSVHGVKSFYGHIMALKGVDLDVHQGEIVTLIGANGAGKSTLIMTIFGNPRAQEGRIIYCGRDITELPTHQIARWLGRKSGLGFPITCWIGVGFSALGLAGPKVRLPAGGGARDCAHACFCASSSVKPWK